MAENFRSSIAIQNYSNMLCEETRGYVREIMDVSDIELICADRAEWPRKILDKINNGKKTAVLRYSNYNAKGSAKDLADIGMNIVYVPQPPIVSITTNTAWLYTAIASYFIIDTYSVYDIIQIIPDEAVGYTKLKKRIEDNLAGIKHALDAADEGDFHRKVDLMATFFGYQTKKLHIEKLYKTIMDKSNHYYFLQDKIDNVAMTFHSAKGLEFEQVVLFAEDYNLYSESSIYNHYVAATRAKNKLLTVYLGEKSDQLFYKNLSNIVNGMNKKVEDFMRIVLK